MQPRALRSCACTRLLPAAATLQADVGLNAPRGGGEDKSPGNYMYMHDKPAPAPLQLERIEEDATLQGGCGRWRRAQGAGRLGHTQQTCGAARCSIHLWAQPWPDCLSGCPPVPLAVGSRCPSCLFQNVAIPALLVWHLVLSEVALLLYARITELSCRYLRWLAPQGYATDHADIGGKWGQRRRRACAAQTH